MSGYTREHAEHWITVLARHEQAQDAAAEIGVGTRCINNVLARYGLGPSSRWTLRGQRMAERGGQGPPTLQSQPTPRLERCHEVAPPINRENQEPGSEISRLVDLCRGKPRSLEQVCDLLDWSPRRARQALLDAQAQGYRVQVSDEEVAWRPVDQDQATEPVSVDVAQPDGHRYAFAAISDTHYGSRFCRHECIAEFIRHAYERGVRVVLHGGDLLDGDYRHSRWDLRAHGWRAQADECIRELPQLDGLRYLFVDGNHDETHSDKAGFLSGQQLVTLARDQGRDDLTYLGPRRAYVQLHGGSRPVRVELWHPRKGKAYALSYALQNHIRDYSPGEKPDILLAGHWHAHVGLEQRGVHAWMVPTFSAPGSSFSKSLGGAVSMGGLIISYELTEGGTLRHVACERSAYYESEGDYALDMVGT